MIHEGKLYPIKAEGAEGLPRRLLILRDGDIEWANLSGVKLTATSAANIIKIFKQQGNELVIDYHHSTTQPQTDELHTRPAAGWIKGLKYIEGEGLWADPVEWTDRAAGFIRESEYKYYSPVIDMDKGSGQITALTSVALTNTPRTKHLTQLLDAAELKQLAAQVQELITMPKKTKKAKGEKGQEEEVPEEVSMESLLPQLAAALLDKGVELAEDAGDIEVVQAAIAFLAAAAEELPEGEASKTLDEVATELNAESKTGTVLVGAIQKLQIKASRHDDIEKRVGELEKEQTDARVKVLMGEVIEAGKLNPHDEKAMKTARALAASDEASFKALFGGMEPILKGGSVVDTNAASGKRVEQIRAARSEYKSDGTDASERFYINAALSEIDESALTDAEVKTLEGDDTNGNNG